VPTLVFDEIDVGISGQAAARVGEKLDALARHHQLLCITHLPQVAARGSQHLLVEKALHGETARTQVTLLQQDQRRLALAKMLGGHNPNDEALRYAQKLLSGG
jgi:DNA repair protein RecN (Recombination protein N)